MNNLLFVLKNTFYYTEVNQLLNLREPYLIIYYEIKYLKTYFKKPFSPTF